MQWLDKKLRTGIWSKSRNLLIIWTTVLVFVFSFPSQSVVRFGYREIKGVAEQTVLKLSGAGARLSSWGRTSDRLPDSGASYDKAVSVIKLWAAWGGTFALLVPLLLFISLNLIIKFRERQTKPPPLPPEDSAIFGQIKSEVIELYFRANRINYIVVSSIVLGMGIILSLFQAGLQVWQPLSPMLIRSSIGTYILYSGILYLYFLFYKGFSKQKVINTIDHYIGLQQGLSTTLAVDFEQGQSTMYHLLLGAISENFHQTKLSRLFPWHFPRLTRKNLLANLTALTFIFLVAQASLPALANISQSARPATGLSERFFLDTSPFPELFKEKDLKYQFAQESLIIKNLSQEILREDDSPLTRSLAEELMKLAADLSRIAIETDNFPASDEYSTELKGRLLSAGFIHEQISREDPGTGSEANPLTTSLEHKDPTVTKNTPSDIKKTAASLAAQVDQLIKELLVYKIKHYNKNNQTPSLRTENNSTPASISRAVPKKTGKLREHNYKKWKDSLKLKKMASNLNRISQNLMAALATDRKAPSSARQFTASSSPADKTASSVKRKADREKGAVSSGAETADSPMKPSSDERILISYKKLKLVKSELEEAQLLLKDWSHEWRNEPQISGEIRASGSRIRELNNQLVKIIEQQEVYLEGGRIPENVRMDSVPRKLAASGRKLLSPPKEAFQKTAGELGKISRKIFRTGENLGNLPSKASDIEVVHNLGRSVPPLAQGLRRRPETVDRLVRELGKISDTLKNRNWGLAGNPAFFNPDSRNKLALKELSKKLKEIASKPEARKLGKELERIAERFQDSQLPEIALPLKGLNKLSPSLKAQAGRFKKGTLPPEDLPLARQSDFTPPQGMSAPPKGLTQLTPKLTEVAQRKRQARLKRKAGPPKNRLLAEHASFENFSPPGGANRPERNRMGGHPDQTTNRSYPQEITSVKQAGGSRNQEWFRPQTAELVPGDYAGGSKGTPPRLPGKGSASQNTAGRRSRGNSRTELTQMDLQPTGQLRNQNNVRELEKIWKNSSLTGTRKGELGSGAVPHDPELIKELRKRYGRQPAKAAQARQTGRPDTSRKQYSAPDFRAGYPGMMGSNKRGMKEKPLADQQMVEQLRAVSPERSQPESMPEMIPLEGNRGSGKGRTRNGINKQGTGKLARKQRVLNQNLTADQIKAASNYSADRYRAKITNNPFPGRKPNSGNLNSQYISRTSLSNPDDLLTELPKDTAGSKATRISQAESLSGEIKRRQSLGNRNDLRNLLSPSPRTLKNRHLGVSTPPSGRLSRNEQDLNSVPQQAVQKTRGHQETLPDHNQKPADGSVKTAASLNRPAGMEIKQLPTQAGQIKTETFSASLERFRQKADQLNKQLKNAQTLSRIKQLSQQIAKEFSEFRSSQLGRSRPPELSARQDRSFHKLASLNSQIQSMPTSIRRQTASQNSSNFKNRLVSQADRLSNQDLERAVRNQDFRKDRFPALKKLTDEMAETAAKLVSKADRGLFPHQPTVSGHPGPLPGTNQQRAKNPKGSSGTKPSERANRTGMRQALSNDQIPGLKKITGKMSKIASQLLGQTERERLPAQGRRLADLANRLGRYQQLEEKQTKKRAPSELSKSIRNLLNLSDKLTDNLINRYRPEETRLLAKQVLNQTRQVVDRLSKSETQPGSLSPQGEQAELAEPGGRPPNKLERFKLQKRFRKTSPLLKYGSKQTDFKPTAGKQNARNKNDFIKQIKQLSKTLESEQDPEKIRKLSNRLSQLAELLGESDRTPLGSGQTASKTDNAGAGKLPNQQQLANRVDLLSHQLQNLGDTPEMNRMKAEFDRLSNHMRTLPQMISSKKKGLSARNDHRSGSNNSDKRKRNGLPMQASMEKRMQDKISRILNRMDRFIDKMGNFYNQKLSKERSANSYEKADSKKTDRKISKDTDSFSKEGPVRNTLSMETDLASPETFQRIIKRLRSQRRNISKLKLPVNRRRKPASSAQPGKVSSKQPTGLEGIRFSSFGEYFPGVSAPKPKFPGGSNINKLYMKKDHEHYQKVEINIKDNLKEQARRLPQRSLKAESKPTTALTLSKKQTMDHSTLTQDVPPVYQDIIKQIFTGDKRKSLPPALKK